MKEKRFVIIKFNNQAKQNFHTQNYVISLIFNLLNNLQIQIWTKTRFTVTGRGNKINNSASETKIKINNKRT